MTETTTARLKSAAIPDAEFDRLSLDEKRAWLKSYLEQGLSQISTISNSNSASNSCGNSPNSAASKIVSGPGSDCMHPADTKSSTLK